MLLVFSVTIWHHIGNAMVRVEVFSDDLEVTLQNETIKLADGSHDYRVTPGDHVLHIKSGNAEFDTDRFTLNKGQNPAVTVQIVEDEIVAKSGAEEVGRRQISSNSDGMKIANAGNEILLKAPEQGFAFTKGSFTVLTISENPLPMKPYQIVIDARLPGDVTNYRVDDFTGEVIGSDGYTQSFPYDKSTPSAVRAPAANGQEVFIDSSSSIDVVNNRVQIIVVLPGAGNLVKDRIKIRSMRLQEDRELMLTWGQVGMPEK